MVFPVNNQKASIHVEVAWLARPLSSLSKLLYPWLSEDKVCISLTDLPAVIDGRVASMGGESSVKQHSNKVRLLRRLLDVSAVLLVGSRLVQLEVLHLGQPSVRASVM